MIEFIIRLNLPHLVGIYRSTSMIGDIDTEYQELTLFESVNYEESEQILTKMKELQGKK